MIHKIPLGAVVGDGDNLVTFLKSKFKESQGKIMGYLIVLFRGVECPCAIDLFG